MYLLCKRFLLHYTRSRSRVACRIRQARKNAKALAPTRAPPPCDVKAHRGIERLASGLGPGSGAGTPSPTLYVAVTVVLWSSSGVPGSSASRIEAPASARVTVGASSLVTVTVSSTASCTEVAVAGDRALPAREGHRPGAQRVVGVSVAVPLSESAIVFPRNGGASPRKERSVWVGGCRWPLSSLIANDSDGYRLRSLGTAAARGDLFSDPRIHFGLDPADGARA